MNPMNPMPDAHPIHGCAENMAINTAITTPEAAVKAQAEVKRKRSVAKALAKDGDITGARFELVRLKRRANVARYPRTPGQLHLVRSVKSMPYPCRIEDGSFRIFPCERISGAVADAR
jgi:hypothetical protein